MQIWTLAEALTTTHNPQLETLLDRATELAGLFGERYADRERVNEAIRSISVLMPAADLILASSDEGSIVGMLTIVFIPNFLEGLRALLDTLVVATPHQTNGIAPALLAKAEEMSRVRGAKLMCVPIDRDAPAHVYKLYFTAGYASDASDGYHKYL